MIFSDFIKPGSPGCALGVYRDGKVIYARGYGLGNIEEKVPITTDSVFDIGSVSKQFTAASIVLLEKQGRLRLDDDVRKYIPELPDYSRKVGQKITILQLLNHTSGLRDYGELFPLAGIHDDNVTTESDALGMIFRQKGLNFTPGSGWQYSNSGYDLLGLIVKRLTGKSLREFEDVNIFRPLGMMHTQLRDDHTLLIPKRVLAYRKVEDGYKLNVPYAEETGDGMVQTTIGDLQKWDENFYTGEVGGSGFATEMEEPGKLNDGTVAEYAKGLHVTSHRGLRVVRHTGGSGGYRAYYMRFPDQHFSIACLCNLQNTNRRKLVAAVAENYLGSQMSPSRDFTEKLTPEQRKAMTGVYRDPKTTETVRVSLQGEKLYANFEGGPLELHPLSPTDFEPVDYAFELELRFEPVAGKNRSPKLIIKREMEFPATFEAIGEVTPAPEELAAYAGDYWSDELLATYRLRTRDGKLWMKDLLGSDGIIHAGIIPFNVLLPVLKDEFDLDGDTLIFHFIRDGNNHVTGFTLDGSRVRGIVFRRKATP